MYFTTTLLDYKKSESMFNGVARVRKKPFKRTAIKSNSYKESIRCLSPQGVGFTKKKRILVFVIR